MTGQPHETKSDRAIYIGRTGSGKSVLLRHTFARVVSQKICIDVNDAERFADVKPVRGRPDRLDWTKPVLHYVPADPYDQAEYEAVYRQIFARRDLCIWLDESYGPTTANASPMSLNLVLTQGRKRNLRHLAATQRPVHIQRNLIGQADHVLLFPKRGFSRRDLATVSDETGLEVSELETAIERLDDSRFGHFAYLHYERVRNILHLRPSVPVRA